MNFRPSLLSSASVLILFSACTPLPPASQDAPPEYDRTPTYPHWAGRPVTWSKLGDIEDWLQGDGPRQYPGYKATAQLELAEGQLELAKKEADRLGGTVLEGRLKAAEAGFHGLLGEASLEPRLKLRAERGVSEIEALRRGRAFDGSDGGTRRSAAGTASLAIQPRSAWQAAGPMPSRLTRVSAGWSRITIHHSAKYSAEIGQPTPGNVARAIHDIQTVHMRDEGYGDIGYHFLIDPVGRIWQGRTLEWQGAHAGGANGANNVSNVGICLLGDFNNERPDPRALASLENLVDALSERHHIARSRIYGHRQLRSTECPGDALMAWVSRYAAVATE